MAARYHAVVGEEPYTEQIDVPEMPLLPSINLNADEPGQKYLCEIWVEKSSQNDWLAPLCEARGVNLVAGIGESSEVRSRELALRASESGAPVRILYLSDFDPAGRSMPKAVARKVEFTVRKLELDVDIKLVHLILTPAQCVEYRLPRIPVKDLRRAAKFEKTFRAGATELDALEALHPGEMARLINAELDRWLDRTLPSRFMRWKSEHDLRAWRISCDVRERYFEEVEDAEEKFQAITDRFESVLAEFATWEMEAADLWAQIARAYNSWRDGDDGVAPS